MAGKGRVARARALRSLVDRGQVERIVDWARGQPDAATLLVARTFDRDDARRWTATVALGRILGEVARERGPEPVRGVIRRLLWLMNDESGGIAWHGPETVAVVLRHAPALLPEYGRIVGSFVDEEPFGPGTCWAIATLAPEAPELFDDLADRVAARVSSPDPFERASALRALGTLRPRAARSAAAQLEDDRAEIPDYGLEQPAVGVTTVARVARMVIESLERAAAGGGLDRRS